MIASLGDLDVGGVGGREPDPGRVVVGDVGGAAGDLNECLPALLVVTEQAVEEGSRSLDLVEPHEGIDLGQLDGKVG